MELCPCKDANKSEDQREALEWLMGGYGAPVCLDSGF